MERTPEEVDHRLRGIVASAAFEGLESSEEDVIMLHRLGIGEITKEEYDRHYGLAQKGSETT